MFVVREHGCKLYASASILACHGRQQIAVLRVRCIKFVHEAALAFQPIFYQWLISVYKVKSVVHETVSVVQRLWIPGVGSSVYHGFLNGWRYIEVLAQIVVYQLFTSGVLDSFTHAVDVFHHAWNIIGKLCGFVDNFYIDDIRFVLDATSCVAVDMV